jgi:hypothetical protein
VNSYSEVVTGPRWVDIEGHLVAYGRLRDVRVSIDHVSKGLFRKSVFFTVTGDTRAVDGWCDDLIRAFTR